MHSTAQTAPRDSEIINELLPWVMLGFESPNSPKGLRYHQGNAVMADAWIRHPKQPLETLISSTKLHPRVTHGFDNPKSP
jgi:hypothetical protein